MLCAAALAAAYVSQPSVWEDFTAWAQEKGILEEGAVMSRAQMSGASRIINFIIRQIEIELLSARLSEALDKKDL
jgi:hypothetical protein